MKRLVALIVLSIALAVPAHAQAAIDHYDQQVFAPGVSPATGSPMWTNTYAVAAVLCGQAKPTVPATVTNPTKFFFDDPSNPTLACIVTIASGMLPALPNGTGYVMTLTATDNVGQTSGRSAASNPFNKQGPPAAPGNPKVI